LNDFENADGQNVSSNSSLFNRLVTQIKEQNEKIQHLELKVDTLEKKNALLSHDIESPYRNEVKPWIVALAKEAGFDIRGYRHKVTQDFKNHVLAEHGNSEIEKSRGQIAVTPEDFDYIDEILDNPTFAVAGIKRKNKFGKMEDRIILVKNTNNGAILYEEILSGKRNKALNAKTLLILQNEITEERLLNILRNNKRNDIANFKISYADAAAAISAIHPAQTAGDGGQIHPRTGTETIISQQFEKSSKEERMKYYGGEKAHERIQRGRRYYNGNAKAFYEGIKDGTLPAVSKEGAEIKDGMITMTPTAIRYYTNGKMFTGVNHLVAQKFAKDLHLRPDKDGNIYVVTYEQAGKRNLLKGQKYFSLASYDEENNQINYYNLYSEAALIDKTKVVQASSTYNERQEHERHSQIAISATDGNISLAEYFGKYEAATKLGAKFVTTEAAITSVRNKAEKELSSYIALGHFEKVYDMNRAIARESKNEMRNLVQNIHSTVPKRNIEKKHDYNIEL